MDVHRKAPLPARRDRLIADYEWLRRLMRHLDMQTEQVDRQLVELENQLPDNYVHPDDFPDRGRRTRK